MLKTIRLEFQKLYAFALVYMISFVALLNLINSLLNMVGVQTVLDTLALYGMLFGLLFVGLLVAIADRRGMKIDIIAVVGIFVLLYAFSYALHPENRRYLVTNFLDYAGNPLYLVFLYSLPAYVFVRKLTDYAYFQKLLIQSSYIIVLMSITIFLFGGNVHGRQYMTFSYNMLLPLLVLYFHKPKRWQWIYRIFLVFSIFIFSIGGARGALVSFFAVIVLYNFVTMRLDKKTIMQLMVMTVAVGLFSVFKDQILSYMLDILDLFSIRSRTLEYIRQDQFLDDSYRFEIYLTALEKISVLGHGMRGDRVFFSGSYTHNIFIELWMDFGWIFGTLISALLLTVIFKGVKNKHAPEHFYAFLFLSTGFFALLLSGSYLNQTPAFFALLGFCVNSIVRKKEQKNGLVS